VAGNDVLLMFLESYGAATYDMSAIEPIVAPARAELAAAAAATGRRVVSAFVTSPTFGGASWLAHSTLMSGFEVRESGSYAKLLTQQRDTVPKLFKAHGYRAIALMPGLKSAWPEGVFYGFDTIYGEREIDYRGPDFGWWRIPDQYALASLHVLEPRRAERGPLFVFLPTINTHIPFLPTPPYQPDWARLHTGQPFDAAAVAASNARTPDWESLGGPYAESFAYTFTYLAGYLREQADSDAVLVLLGDHQPAASVAGLGARWEVPVHIVTRRDDIAAALLERASSKVSISARNSRRLVRCPSSRRCCWARSIPALPPATLPKTDSSCAPLHGLLRDAASPRFGWWPIHAQPTGAAA
jgi:hypothetical protein